MKMRLTVLIVLLLMLTLVATSCQTPAEAPEPPKDDTPTTTPEAPEAEEPPAAEEPPEESKPLKFGYIAYNFQDQWNAVSMEGFKAFADEMGVEVIAIDGALIPENYISGMNDLITNEVDAICVFTLTPELDVTCAEMANEAGIPLVFENSLPAENVGDHLATVMANYSQVAYESLKQIADLWPGAKVFFAGGTLGMGVTEEYLVGIEEAKNDGIDATVVGDLYSEWTAEGAMNTVLDFIQTDTEFDVVYANCDIMGVGAISALKEAGRFGDIKVHTPGGSPETLDLLKNGEQDATLNIATPAQGGMAFKILYDYVTDGKEPKEKVFFTPLIPVTLENIGDAMDWNDTSKVRELVEDTLN